MIFKAQEFSFRCYDCWWPTNLCKWLYQALSCGNCWMMSPSVFQVLHPELYSLVTASTLFEEWSPFWKRWSVGFRPSKKRHQWVWFSPQTVEDGRILENLLERKENEYSNESNEQNEARKCYRASIHQLSTWSAFTVREQHCCQAGPSPWIAT